MSMLKKFDFSEDFMQVFRASKSVPIDFYNKDGQILIRKKQNLADSEMDRVMRFVAQGIYYREEDEDKLIPSSSKKSVNSSPQEGLSNTRLLSKEHALQMTSVATEIISQVRNSPVSHATFQKSSDVLNKVFSDFKSQPDAMIGLVNIIELMGGMDSDYLIELMVKRSVVAMAIVTRGMFAVSQKEKKALNEIINSIMLSSFLCDISYTRMKMPQGPSLSTEEFNYIQNHPVMSYMMVAHEREISTKIKTNILIHHHPLRSEDKINNNYPSILSILQKLGQLYNKYKDDIKRQHISHDIAMQMNILKKGIFSYEDANILALASAFASLTTKTPWRPAFPDIKAVRIIINQSLFTYSQRITREFLDYTAMSLCNNQKILKEGNYLILAAKNNKNEIAQYEVAEILSITHIQSRPGIRRIAIIEPKFGRNPRIGFVDLNLQSMRKDLRRAYYELNQDTSRQIAYIVDPQDDKEAHEQFTKLKSS